MYISAFECKQQLNNSLVSEFICLSASYMVYWWLENSCFRKIIFSIFMKLSLKSFYFVFQTAENPWFSKFHGWFVWLSFCMASL